MRLKRALSTNHMNSVHISAAQILPDQGYRSVTQLLFLWCVYQIHIQSDACFYWSMTSRRSILWTRRLPCTHPSPALALGSQETFNLHKKNLFICKIRLATCPTNGFEQEKNLLHDRSSPHAKPRAGIQAG